MIKVNTGGLGKLRRNIENLGRKKTISLGELFPPSFMSAHTDFQSLDEMFSSSGFKIESQQDFKDVPDAEWDVFVAKRTRFSNWEEMQKTALNEYVSRKLHS